MISHQPHNNQIYLDFNATTPVLPEVAEAMGPWLTGKVGNASSKHLMGKTARDAVEKARHQLAELIQAKPSEITFTSGGTEASTLALRGMAPDPQGLFGRIFSRFKLFLSAADHPVSIETALDMARSGQAKIRWLPLDKQGCVDMDRAAGMIRGGRGLATVLVAHNESGTLQPVKELAELCHSRGISLHADGAQAVGKIPCDVRELGCDFLTIAGHKMGAPQGIGALYIRDGLHPKPQVLGGGQEKGQRAGTEPVALIVGLGKAAEVASHTMSATNQKLLALREDLWNRLQAALGDRILRITHPTKALPNTLFISLRGVDTGKLLADLPALCASTGSACHDGRHQSRLLGAMGVDSVWHTGTLRLSLGKTTTPDEIFTAADWIVSRANQR
jgi:cysteine desulfurase